MCLGPWPVVVSGGRAARASLALVGFFAFGGQAVAQGSLCPSSSAPVVAAAKTASVMVLPAAGGVVAFTYTVEACVASDLWVEALHDDQFGDLADSVANPGTTCSLGARLNGANPTLPRTYQCQVTKLLPPGASGSAHVNTFTATVLQGDVYPFAEATLSIPYSEFDLALSKTTPLAGPVYRGQPITFDVTVYNQGAEPATDIELIDYVDSSMWMPWSPSLNPPGTTSGSVGLSYSWSASGSDARATLAGTIRPLESVTLPLTLVVAPGAPSTLTNTAEVFSDNGLDNDSQPEEDENDRDADPTVDDETNNAGGDEDDEDIAVVSPAVMLSVGNRVWLDDGAGGGVANNGLLDGAEAGVPGVRLELLDASGQPVDFGTGPLVAHTDFAGHYLFDDLPPGAYVVRVSPSNFALSAPLANLMSSQTTESVPDGDQDLNDNGLDSPAPGTHGVQSGVLTLAMTGEPVGESDLGLLASGNAADQGSNLTLDFGFFYPMSLGNTVWDDLDNNGRQDLSEPGISGVILSLTDGLGSPVLDPSGAPMRATTGPNGQYLFDGLMPGTYMVLVESSNFQSGAALDGALSSNGPLQESDPNQDVDLNDNGVDHVDPAGHGIWSNPLALAHLTEPIGEPGNAGNAVDGDSNNSLDFGFHFSGASPPHAVPSSSLWSLLTLVALLAAAGLRFVRH